MDTVTYRCEKCGDTEGWTCGEDMVSVSQRFLIYDRPCICARNGCRGYYTKVEKPASATAEATVKLRPIAGCECTEPWHRLRFRSYAEWQRQDKTVCDAQECSEFHPIDRSVEPSAAKGKKDFDGSIDGAGYKGSMDDPSKPPLSLVTRTFLWQVAAVLGIGATKYARGNWMRGMSFSETANGVLRHITSWLSGETYDPETGRNHLAHAACGLMFLLTFQEGPRKDEYACFDDRLVEGEST